MECWDGHKTISEPNHKKEECCAAAFKNKNYCQACLTGNCCAEAPQSETVEQHKSEDLIPNSSQFSQKMMDFYSESSYQESHDELYSEVKEYVNDYDMYEPSDSEILHRLLFTSTLPKDEPLEIIWESSNEEEEDSQNSNERGWLPEENTNVNLCFDKANSLVWQIENCFLETAHLLDRASLANEKIGRDDTLKELPVSYKENGNILTLSMENLNNRVEACASPEEEHDYVNISECYSDKSNLFDLYDQPKHFHNDGLIHCNEFGSNDISQEGHTYQNLSCIDYTSSDDLSLICLDERSIEELFRECFEYSSKEPNTSVDACLRNLENLFHHLRIAKNQITGSKTDYDFIEKCRYHFNDLLFNEAVTVLNSSQFSFIEKAIEKAMLKNKSEYLKNSNPIVIEDKTKKHIAVTVSENNTNENYYNGNIDNSSPIIYDNSTKANVMTYEDTLELYRDNKELQDSLLSILSSLNDIHDNFLKRRKTEIDYIQNSASSMLQKVISAVVPTSDNSHDYVNFPLEKFTTDENLTEDEAIRQITEVSHELKYLWKTYHQSRSQSLRRSKSVRSRSRLSLSSQLCQSLPNLTSLQDSRMSEFTSNLEITPSQCPTDRLKNFVLQMKSENRKCYDITVTFLRKIMQKYGIDRDTNIDSDLDRKPFYPEDPPIDYTKTH